MKIELVGGWSVKECEVEIQFKGQTLGCYWSTDEGYEVFWGDANFTDDEKEELENLLREADTPVLRFEGGSYELEIKQ